MRHNVQLVDALPAEKLSGRRGSSEVAAMLTLCRECSNVWGLTKRIIEALEKPWIRKSGRSLSNSS